MKLRDHAEGKILEVVELVGLNALTSVPADNPVGKVTVYEDMIRFVSGINTPVLNLIGKVRFTRDNAERRINESMEYFKEKKLPMTWWIGPSCTPSHLPDLLRDAGLYVPEKEQKKPGMVCDLRNLNENQFEEAIDRSLVKIVKVETDKNFKTWSKVFYEGYDLYGPLGDAFIELTMINNFENYLATMNGKPVAISSVFYNSGVAAIFNVATIPDYRRKGIGTAITLEPVLEAKKRGYEIAFLESSEMGSNVYRKIGFRGCFNFRCIYNPNNNNL